MGSTPISKKDMMSLQETFLANGYSQTQINRAFKRKEKNT